MSSNVPQPWRVFLRDIDRALTESVELHCVGGFAATMLYHLPRPTAHIDLLEVLLSEQCLPLLQLAGNGAPLHRKHNVYLQKAAVADLPDCYERRLRPIFPGAYKNIRLLGLDPYDLVLSKMQRNSTRDRADVGYLARTIPLDGAVLQSRYEMEMRPYLAQPEREDLTLRLWLEEYFLPPPEPVRPRG